MHGTTTTTCTNRHKFKNIFCCQPHLQDLEAPTVRVSVSSECRAQCTRPTDRCGLGYLVCSSFDSELVRVGSGSLERGLSG